MGKLEDIQKAKLNLAECFEGLSKAVEISKDRFLKVSMLNKLYGSKEVDSFGKTLVKDKKDWVGYIDSRGHWNDLIDMASLTLKTHVDLLTKALETHKSLCDAYIKQ